MHSYVEFTNSYKMKDIIFNIFLDLFKKMLVFNLLFSILILNNKTQLYA